MAAASPLRELFVTIRRRKKRKAAPAADVTILSACFMIRNPSPGESAIAFPPRGGTM
jgi:hypothetical protein